MKHRFLILGLFIMPYAYSESSQETTGHHNFSISGNHNSLILPTDKLSDANPGESFKEDVLIRSDFKIPAVLLERPEILKKIEYKLELNKGINMVALIGVVGVGGAGKTVLARQFGKLSNFPIVWELNAERKESLIASFQELAQAMAVTSKKKQELNAIITNQNKQEKEKNLLFLIKKWLKEKQNWLLLYDNIENINSIIEWFPQDSQVWGNGKVIITTRDSNIENTNYVSQENIVQIEQLSEREKLILFSKIFYNKLPEELLSEQKDYAISFLNNIPPFPLDISVAAYYLKMTGTTFDKYLKNLHSHDAEFERVSSLLLKETGDYTKTRYSIITMSLERLIYSNSDFKDLVLLISLLDSQNIPREFLCKYKPDTVIGEFIYNFKKYSFITSETSTNLGSFFSIHRSTQAIILAYLKQNLHLEQNKKLIDPIATVLEEYISSLIDKEDVSRMNTILSHCESFLGEENILTEEIKSYISASLGGIYHHISYDATKTAELFQNSLIRLKNSNDKLILAARTMTLLADLHRRVGKYEEAEKLLYDSQAIYEKNNKHTIGEGYNLASLGLFYQAMGNYKKAKEFLSKSIEIYDFFSKNTVGRARTLAYQGITHADLGLYRESIEYMKRSLKIYKIESEFHFRIWWVLMYIGDVCRKLGDYPQALQSIKESINLQKKIINNKKDLNTIRAMSYLGIIYGELGNYEEAVNYIEQSVELYKEYHPTTFDRIWSGAHLAKIYREMGEYEKAQTLIEVSLSLHNSNIKENTNDIRTAWLLAKLGSINNNIGNYTEAWKLISTSLNTYQNHLGEDNIKTAKILTYMGEVYKNLGKYNEAMKCFKSALIQYKRNYGEEHIKTAELLNSVANVYILENNFLEAEAILNRALAVFNAANHSKIYVVWESFGDLYFKMAFEAQNMNNLKKAKDLIIQMEKNYKEALKAVKTTIKNENSAHIMRLSNKLENTLKKII